MQRESVHEQIIALPALCSFFHDLIQLHRHRGVVANRFFGNLFNHHQGYRVAACGRNVVFDLCLSQQISHVVLGFAKRKGQPGGWPFAMNQSFSLSSILWMKPFDHATKYRSQVAGYPTNGERAAWGEITRAS